MRDEMGIMEWPAQERPRERLLRLGPQALSDAELLALFLRNGDGARDVVSFARHLLMQFGSLRELLEASNEGLMSIPGIGPAKAAVLKATLALAQRYLEAPLVRGGVFSGSADVRRYLQQKLGGRLNEVFAALFLDSQHRLLRYEELFFGTIDSASVYPREVVRMVLAVNAAAVIFVHNHPSGVAEPSRTDVELTERLTRALQYLDVRVLDHMVVAANDVVSMAERGLL
jgi:DNA repair protein RadC